MRILNFNGDPKDIFTEFFNKKGSGQKTSSFYQNILEPENPNFVTIDRHMIIALGLDWKSITGKRYKEASDKLIKRAKILDILPNQLQAIIWETYKDIQDTLFNHKVEQLPDVEAVTF